MLLIVQDGPQQHRITGRVARIIRYLVTTERLITCDKIRVAFDCAGDSVSVEVKERERLDTARLSM